MPNATELAAIVVLILAVSPALVNVALPVTSPVNVTVTALDNASASSAVPVRFPVKPDACICPCELMPPVTLSAPVVVLLAAVLSVIVTAPLASILVDVICLYSCCGFYRIQEKMAIPSD